MAAGRTPEEARRRTWRVLMTHAATIKVLVEQGIDPTKPEHLIIARTCALWVKYCAEQRVAATPVAKGPISE